MEEKHQAFLNERSDKPNEKAKYPYKHRSVRVLLQALSVIMNIFLPMRNIRN